MWRPDPAHQEAVYQIVERKIITTADGSSTLHLPEWDETYHSRHGAIQEAEHVFIRNGLDLFPDKDLSILEMGFGTGLNCLLTWKHQNGREIRYTSLEAFPLTSDEYKALNYCDAVGIEGASVFFNEMVDAEWESEMAIADGFYLEKRQIRFEEFEDAGRFDLIYFDAFGYRVQPELWSEDIFRRMFAALKPGGILVTYAARSVIRRNMKAAGFTTETLAGPPGKREMTRAEKPELF